MIKLKSVKLGYSVRCGTKEDVFFHDSHFEMYLDKNGMIHMRDHRGSDWTHVFQTNVAWFKSDEMSADLNKMASQKDDIKPAKAKAKPAPKTQASAAVI